MSFDAAAPRPRAPDATALATLRDRRTWIFDLDNTLYPPDAGLLAQVNARMTAFIMRELGLDRARAEDLRNRYWRRYGITLEGLRRHHGVVPSRFLDEVHDIDLVRLRPDAALLAGLDALAGNGARRLVVHTNGSRAHARRVLDRLGLAGRFEAVYAIEDKDLIPKPGAEAYARVVAAEGLDPSRAAMLEDTLANLAEPKRLGMATLWVTPRAVTPPAHVDHVVPALVPFIQAVA